MEGISECGLTLWMQVCYANKA